MILLLNYQERAVFGDGSGTEGLAPAIKRLLPMVDAERQIVLEAPTGSGKTAMLAAALAESATRAAVLWFSVGKGRLADQSARALDRYLEGTALSVSRLDEAWLSNNPSVHPGHILVINWESVNQTHKATGQRKNRLTSSEVRDFFDVLRNTVAVDTPLIIVIDESHWGDKAKGTTSLLEEIDAIGPSLRIKASATPTQELSATTSRGRARQRVEIVVPLGDVIEAGMVSTEVRVNTGLQGDLALLSEADLAGLTGESAILVGALDKTEELTLLYSSEEIGSACSPLLLIQLPDGAAGAAKLESVEKFFEDQRGWTRENGQLAVWLSNDKTPDLDKLADFDSPVRVLVFKTAIATGWDCPRAQVLVAFRELKSEIFSIQTVGRIMRTAERRHYGNADLDACYIYSNIEAPRGPRIGSDDVPPAADVELLRKVAALTLKGSYASRAGTYNDIRAGVFGRTFKAIAASMDLLGGLPDEPPSLMDTLLTDRVVTIGDVADRDSAIEAVGSGQVAVRTSDTDRQAQYEAFLAEHIGGYRAKRRSVDAFKSALSSWAKAELTPKWGVEDDALIEALQVSVLQHQDSFARVLDAAVAIYAAGDQRRLKGVKSYDWQLPAAYQVCSQSHQLLAPGLGYAYADAAGTAWRTAPSGPELAVESALSKMVSAADVVWWWKNGVGDTRFFSLDYVANGGDAATMYPDYLLELAPASDGRRRIAVLECKGLTDTDPDTALKAAALAKWKVSIRQQDIEVLVGVVVPDAHGHLMVNPGSGYTNPSASSLADPGSGWTTWEKFA